MPSLNEKSTALRLDEIEEFVGPIIADQTKTLVESMELVEERITVRFLGFELKRWKRAQQARRRLRSRWRSILVVLVLTSAGILKLWLGV